MSSGSNLIFIGLILVWVIGVLVDLHWRVKKLEKKGE